MTKVFGTAITHVRSLWWTRFISLSENECRLGGGFAETRLREIELFTRPPVKRRRDVNRRFEICLRGNFRTSSIASRNIDSLKYLGAICSADRWTVNFWTGAPLKASKARVERLDVCSQILEAFSSIFFRALRSFKETEEIFEFHFGEFAICSIIGWNV